MVLSDQAGRIILENTKAERLFGYSRDELRGKKVEILVPPVLRGLHRRHRAAYYVDPGLRHMAIGREIYLCHKDGTELPVDISLSSLKIGGDLLVWSAIRSISDREHIICELRDSLNKVKGVTGLITICAWCKRIFDELGSWQPLDSYIQFRTETQFSHGMCNDCLKKLNPLSHTGDKIPNLDFAGHKP